MTPTTLDHCPVCYEQKSAEFGVDWLKADKSSSWTAKLRSHPISWHVVATVKDAKDKSNILNPMFGWNMLLSISPHKFVHPILCACLMQLLYIQNLWMFLSCICVVSCLDVYV